MEDKKIELSLKDRLYLVNQYRILQKLSENDWEKKDYENLIEILSKGYVIHYDDLFLEIYPEELSIETSRKALDILEMYRGIIFSVENLRKEGTKINISNDQIRFPGFDGNDNIEGAMMNYITFFIENLGRYNEIKALSGGDYNSHCSMLNTYDRMLKIWNALDSSLKYRMSEELINKILHS